MIEVIDEEVTDLTKKCQPILDILENKTRRIFIAKQNRYFYEKYERILKNLILNGIQTQSKRKRLSETIRQKRTPSTKRYCPNTYPTRGNIDKGYSIEEIKRSVRITKTDPRVRMITEATNFRGFGVTS